MTEILSRRRYDCRRFLLFSCIVGKIVQSQIKWAGHMVRMKDDKLPERAETKKQEGSRKRGRPRLRMGRMCEEGSEKGRGGGKVERKGPQQGPMEANYENIRTSQ